MSKRYFPQQFGDRKKPRLDFSIIDRVIPLSQNKEPGQADIWGDDNEDEMLLLASQACEEACNANESLLPDYSLCMQPQSTSTQIFSPAPSTSKTDFTFKRPSTNAPSVISKNLRENCNRISSPLPGITANIMPKANEPNNLTGDFMFNDKVFNSKDANYTYQQLLQLQEEYTKLKSENCKLLEKCVTKEGEASILRTQLKTCQVSVDNARLDKIKAQEKVQIEWTEKLAAVNNQMNDLRTQLDFKNLEIISIKEKCKKLESSKINLTQVTLANKDLNTSYRPNISNDSMTYRKVKTLSSAVQTDKADFLALSKSYRTATSPLPSLLLLLLQPTAPCHSILEYNEKLIHTDVPYKCASVVYSTFHRPAPVKKEGKIKLATVYEDVVKIANGREDRDIYFKVFNAAKSILNEVISRLETISQRMTTAFQREMDNKYLDTTYSFIDVRREHLLKGGPLYKEEQEILARRITAILSYILQTAAGREHFNYYEQSSENKGQFTECVYRICTLLETTSTTPLHSGLLFSLVYTLHTTRSSPKTLSIIKTMLSSRPTAAVSCQLLEMVREVSLWENFREEFCRGTVEGNLRMDYEQGVLLYSKDNCNLQILLKQIEASLKCIEKQQLSERAAETTRHLILLYCNLDFDSLTLVIDKSRCNCQLLFLQILVYALRICAVMLQNSGTENNAARELLSVCRCGAHALYQCWAREAEFGAQLAGYEGHLVLACEILRDHTHSDTHANMMSELSGSDQSRLEDVPSPIYKEPWLKSFQTFSVND